MGDSSTQEKGSNGELLVRFPNFPLSWEFDGESDSESDYGEPVAGNLAGEENADPPW
jgi:hypothetical protein